MSKHTRHIIVLIALCLPFAACSPSSDRNATAAAGGRGAGGPVPVVTTRVEQKAMPVMLAAVGAVEAIASVQIHAQVTGQLSAIHFVEGQEVEKGQPLFSIDARPFEAAVQQAEAVLARDTATWQNAQDQQARLESLFKRGLVSRDQYEAQRATASALAGTVAADKAAIDSARLNLQFTEIKAPISGRTGSLGAHQGDLIRANDTNALVVINQLSPVYVAFSLSGRYLTDIRRYQGLKPLQVSAVLPLAADQSPSSAPGASGPGLGSSAGQVAPGQAPVPASAQARGTVTFIDNTVDPMTGTIRLKATFANIRRQLWPGAFVQVSLELTTDLNALVVPAVAVQTSQDGQFVYVVRPDRTAEMRPVKVDRQQGDEVVIASGVSAGETVVTDGHLRLTPGSRVSERGEAPVERGQTGGRAGSHPQDRGGRPGGR